MIWQLLIVSSSQGNIILAPGGSPRVPTFIQPLVKRPHVIHSSAYATSINNVLAMVYEGAQSKPLRLAVIGSGQSAAEVTMDLRERLSSFPSATRHHIDLLIRKGALKPSDDSPFANEIFNPECECCENLEMTSSNAVLSISNGCKLRRGKRPHFGIGLSLVAISC